MPNSNEIEAEIRKDNNYQGVRLRYCQDLGLNVEMIERRQNEQDIILSIHHACSLSLMHTPLAKLIMNHNDVNIALRAS